MQRPAIELSFDVEKAFLPEGARGPEVPQRFRGRAEEVGFSGADPQSYDFEFHHQTHVRKDRVLGD
ncbi:MAG: hypothetical protein MUC63_08195, partial [Planctomycetes bacterium]|nr:hypothetical protein [Planctomycetota bacterium]